MCLGSRLADSHIVTRQVRDVRRHERRALFPEFLRTACPVDADDESAPPLRPAYAGDGIFHDNEPN